MQQHSELHPFLSIEYYSLALTANNFTNVRQCGRKHFNHKTTYSEKLTEIIASFTETCGKRAPSRVVQSFSVSVSFPFFSFFPSLLPFPFPSLLI